MKNLLFISFLFLSSLAVGQCSLNISPIDFSTVSPNNMSVFKCSDGYVVLIFSFSSADDSPYQVTITKDGQNFVSDSYSSINPQSPSFQIDSLFYAGVYDIQVVGASGDSCSDVITYAAPPALTLDVAVDSPGSCEINGDIIVTNISGGLAPYDVGQVNSVGIFDPVYLSNVTNNFFTINSLLAGFYSFTVQDDFGCLTDFGQDLPIEITQSNPMSVSINIDEMVTVCVEGGFPPYFFVLGNDTVTTSVSCVDYSLCQGDYSVVIYDSYNGGFFCSDTIDFTIDDIVAEIDQDIATAVITNGGLEPFEYSWSFNGQIVEGENDATYKGEFCAGSYLCRITDNLNCVVNTTLVIDELEINLTEDVDCSDLEIEELTTDVKGGTSPYSYLWNTEEITANIAILEPITYSVSVTDVHDCNLLAQVNIPVLSDSCLFDAISPNGDQTNDFWTINPSFIFPDTEINIYNRWGAQIFESVGYQTPWDGTNKNGTKVSEGVYFYVITFNNGIENTKGSISVFY
jgi:gliding motility-associated-like protein